MSGSPFDTLRNTDYPDRSNTSSPAESGGKGWSSGWSSDGWDMTSPQSEQASMPSLSHRITVKAGTKAKVSDPLISPAQAPTSSSGVSSSTPLPISFDSPRQTIPFIPKQVRKTQDQKHGVKREFMDETEGPSTAVGAVPSGSFYPHEVPKPDRSPWVPVGRIQGVADPSIRHRQASSALDILQKLLGKITDSETLLYRENVLLREALLTSDSGEGSSTRPATEADLALNRFRQTEEENKRKNLVMANISLTKELDKERAAHATTKERLRELQLRSLSTPSDKTQTGISRTVITELALKLTEQGPSAAASVAGLLFDEVARVASIEEDLIKNWTNEKKEIQWQDSHQAGWKIQKDKQREAGLGPSQRLINVEGVVDVTLGRVDELERDVKRLKGFV